MKKPAGAPLHVNSLAELHQLFALPAPMHPLISLLDLRIGRCPSPDGISGLVFNFYSIWLKEGAAGELPYGQGVYELDGRAMLFMAPGQVLDTHAHQHTGGWGLAFHPAFIRGHAVATLIAECGFFSYASYEALHLTAAEDATMAFLHQHLTQECALAPPHFSQPLVLTSLELLLRYASRFYQRQLTTAQPVAHGLLANFERVLAGYLRGEQVKQHGLPTVQYLADQLHVSPTYLSDLLRALTGLSTQQHLHQALVARAQDLLSTTVLSISEIAFLLGYEHSQSFSKMFHSKTGGSPLAFRRSQWKR